MQQCILTVCCEKCYGGSMTTCTSGTSNAVNIVLRVGWIIIIEDVSNVTYVFTFLRVSNGNRTQGMAIVIILIVRVIE
jgi:hypothetical protein